jgi:glucose/arabinose dehydrogenase
VKRALFGIGILTLTLAAAPVASAQPASLSVPELTVTEVMGGLSRPWDVVLGPDGTVLTGERSGRFVAKHPDGSVTTVSADLGDLYASGETGLMGIALATDFESTRTLYTCQGVRGSGPAFGSVGGTPNTIEVRRWTVDENWTTLTKAGTVIGGIPTSPIGRHGGCRVLAHPDGTLYVGTGDTAAPSVPQDPNSLGGKVLHIDADGTPAAGNPDPASPVFTLGHRNVQGLAISPQGRIYSQEQGTDRDDELNLLRAGGNYGYKPDRMPLIYDESVPMTDPVRVPGAIPAVWSSGSPVLATPGLAFAVGSAWGDLNGAAVITSQQQRKLEFVTVSADGATETGRASALDGAYGRVRSLTALADGSLLMTTDNGTDDRVLLVTPTGN